MQGARMGAPQGPRRAPDSPWYSPHTGTIIHNLVALNDKQNSQFRVEIYPSGVKLTRAFQYKIQPENLPPRGAITGFSHEAARNLREAFFTTYVPGFDLWSATFTTHAIFTPTQWRAIMKRFRMAVLRAGWAGIWRVELQRRSAPHAHVAMWLPPGVLVADVRDMWLSASGELADMAARKNAVCMKKVDHDEAGWAVYMGMHNGKHKSEQLGWLGKQWGVWNKDKFVKREPLAVDLPMSCHAPFLRILAGYFRSQLTGKIRRKEAQLAELVADIPGMHVVPDKRPPLQKMHRGNLLRCVNGEVVERIVALLRAQP